MTAPPRVVVTGAAGFVGAALVRRLVTEGHAVLAWVRPESDLRRLDGVPSIEVLPLDLGAIVSPSGCAAARSAIADFGASVLVHAAWRGTRGGARDDAAQLNNVAPSVEIVRLASAAGVRRFIGLGSQAEYGPQDAVITEETRTAPANPYGASKLAAGHLSLALAKVLDLSAAWVRVFSVYGPGERSGALIPDLAAALKDRRSFPLGPCEARWDYLYEDDAAAALARLVVRSDARGFFNLASGNAVPLREVVAKIEALVGSGTSASIGTRPPHPADPPRLEADIRRIRRAIDWTPATSLDEGLARTVSAITGEARRIVAADN